MKITPFLMFTGEAGAALDFYVATFPGAELLSIERHGADGPGIEGTVLRAVISITGQQLICMDSPPVHDFGFTPSISMFVECDDETMIDRLWSKLGEGGTPLMPIGDYGFSRKFAWLNDRFGVSWQLNLP